MPLALTATLVLQLEVVCMVVGFAIMIVTPARLASSVHASRSARTEIVVARSPDLDLVGVLGRGGDARRTVVAGSFVEVRGWSWR